MTKSNIYQNYTQRIPVDLEPSQSHLTDSHAQQLCKVFSQSSLYEIANALEYAGAMQWKYSRNLPEHMTLKERLAVSQQRFIFQDAAYHLRAVAEHAHTTRKPE
jgi:uncharacterized protein (DUF427 family)